MVQEIFTELALEFKTKMKIKDILSLFGISKSSYYRWKKRNLGNSELNESETMIINICKDTNYEYGYRSVKEILATQGHHVNKNTVQRIMQKYHLQCRVKPKRLKHFKGKEATVAANVLNRDFKSERRLEKLVTDVTYLPWGEKTLYLSSIMDLYNGEIIAYTLGEKQDIEFVLDTLHQIPEITKPCILHSDQGSVYTSRAYQTQVQRKSITMSMSNKGTPADNASIESFHSSLKSETFYRFPELKSSIETITQTVVKFIKHYNTTRIQAKLGYMSPIQYRESHTPA